MWRVPVQLNSFSPKIQDVFSCLSGSCINSPNPVESSKKTSGTCEVRPRSRYNDLRKKGNFVEFYDLRYESSISVREVSTRTTKLPLTRQRTAQKSLHSKQACTRRATTRQPSAVSLREREYLPYRYTKRLLVVQYLDLRFIHMTCRMMPTKSWVLCALMALATLSAVR